MWTFAIPTFVYVEAKDHDEARRLVDAVTQRSTPLSYDDLIEAAKALGSRVELLGLHVHAGEPIEMIGDYQTPEGNVSFDVKINLKYEDPVPHEEEGDANPGDYQIDVKARNGFEAIELALDKFHQTYPISDLDDAIIDAQIVSRSA